MPISTAIDPSARARGVGIKTTFKNLGASSAVILPQRVAVIGQGATAATYATTKTQFTTSKEVGDAYGFGSPIHLASKQIFPDNGDGIGTIPATFYPLEDDGSGVVSSGDITPSGTITKAGAFRVSVNNILSESFVIAAGDSVATIVAAIVAAINANIDMPIIAVDGTTLVTFTSKWEGTSANDIVTSISGTSDTGVAYAITQAAGGLVNPDVQDALDQVGDIWETMVVDCLEATDTTTLDIYDAFGEGRWGALVRKPLVVFHGSGEAVVNTAIAIPDARKTDRTNVTIPVPGSVDLPCVIAAEAVKRAAVLANNNPAHDYGRQRLNGLTPGTDAEQWTFAQRDQAIKAGLSSTQVRDGEVVTSDTVTYYHPDGEVNPAFAYVVNIVKVQNTTFNIDLIFDSPEWDGAPLIPDDQPTVNPDAKRPKDAVAEVASLLDTLGLAAIISDPEGAKKRTQAGINGTNPNRLDLLVSFALSGNSNIVSIDQEFGFFFGTQTIIS